MRQSVVGLSTAHSYGQLHHTPQAPAAQPISLAQCATAPQGINQVEILEDNRRVGRPARRYLKGKFLGKGGFAKCYEAQDLETLEYYAVKVVAKSSLTKARAKAKLITEIQIHRTLDHPRVVQYHSHFDDAENVYIILEICPNQSLHEMLRKKKRFTEQEAAMYVSQLVDGLQYLKSQKVIHRDLKLGNLFLGKHMELKIGDFGLAAKLEFDGQKRTTICGTPNYIAPEILLNSKDSSSPPVASSSALTGPFPSLGAVPSPAFTITGSLAQPPTSKSAGHSFPVDVWSVGVILFTMLTGKPPFEDQDVKSTYQRIRDLKYQFPDQMNISPAARHLVSWILRSDPSTRPTLEEILNHTWVRSMTRPNPSGSQCMPLAQYMAMKNMRLPEPKLPERASDENREAVNKSPDIQLNTVQSARNFFYPTGTPKKDDDPNQARIFDSPGQKIRHSMDVGNVKAADLIMRASGGVLPRVSSARVIAPALNASPRFEEPPMRSNTFRSIESNSNYRPMDSPRPIRGSSGRQIGLLNHSLPSTYLLKFIDYSSKYGLGYLTSTKEASGEVKTYLGVYFNDATKMVVDLNDWVDVFYMTRSKTEKKDSVQLVKMLDISVLNYVSSTNMDSNRAVDGRNVEGRVACDYSQDVRKKLILMRNFRAYLSNNNDKEGTSRGNSNFSKFESTLQRDIIGRESYKRLNVFAMNNAATDAPIYVSKWVKTRHSTILLLSNNAWHIVFNDGYETMLLPCGTVCLFLDKTAGESCKAYYVDCLNDIPEDFISRRLTYTKSAILQIIGGANPGAGGG